ncbi:MAG: hypothetical protein JWQ27_335 [Ferruginibacter sp.]|nr:hypothetical protein [Ferruginibacter sp.]
MKLFFLLCISGLLFSCHNNKAAQETTQEKFDQAKWNEREADDYPYRDKMLTDLLGSKRLKGMQRDTVLAILGEPTRSDSGYLFYRVSQEKLGPLTLHAKTLVIKFAGDSLVEWTKIHE